MGANYDWLARGVQPVNPYAQEGHYLQLQQLQSEQQLRQQQTQQIALQNQQMQQQMQGLGDFNRVLQGQGGTSPVQPSATQTAPPPQPSATQAGPANSAPQNGNPQAQPQSGPAVQGAPAGSSPAGPGAASPPAAPSAAQTPPDPTTNDPYPRYLKAMDDPSIRWAPGQYLQQRKAILDAQKDELTNAKSVQDAAKAHNDSEEKAQGILGGYFNQIVQNGGDPAKAIATLHVAQQALSYDPIAEQHLASFQAMLAQPGVTADHVNQLFGPLAAQYGTPVAKAQQELSSAKTTQEGAKFKNAAEERAQATQDLQAAGSDPTQLQSWKQQYPDIAKNVNTSDPASIQRFLASSVPVKEQPDYQIKLKQADFMQNLTPKSLSDLVDQTVPPTGSTAAANKQIKAEATAAVSMGGDANAIRAVIDKGVEAVRAQGLQVGAKQMEAGTQLSIAAQNRAAQQGFQSYTQSNSELDKIGNPIEQTAQKVADIKDLMAENSPQAWANIPAKVLSLTAGGTGSGLRMNQALLDKELGGAGKWAELQGKFQAWNPNSAKASEISDAQKAQFKSVVASLEKQTQARLDVVNGARTDLLGAGNDVNQHRNIVLGVHQKLQGLDQQAGQAGQSGGPVRIATKADHDKLAPGTPYIGPDGKNYVKGK